MAPHRVQIEQNIAVILGRLGEECIAPIGSPRNGRLGLRADCHHAQEQHKAGFQP
jgi:hypothetical protein